MSQQFLEYQQSGLHGDSIWKLLWTDSNQIVSASVDGNLRIWDPSSPSSPTYIIPSPSTLSLTSLSSTTSAAGTFILTCTMEGIVSLVDASSGKVLGRRETGVVGVECGRKDGVGKDKGGEVLPAFQVSLQPNPSSSSSTTNTTPNNSLSSVRSWASTGSTSRIAIYSNMPEYPSPVASTSSSSSLARKTTATITSGTENDMDVDMVTGPNGDKGQETREGELGVEGHGEGEEEGEEEKQPLGLGECVKVISIFEGELSKRQFGMGLKYSPDGSSLAVSTQSGHVALIDTESLTVVKMFTSHALPVRALAWTPESQFLFSGSDDRRIVLYDIKAGRSTASERGGSVIDIHGHKGWVLGLSVSDDGKSLVSGSADHTIKVWDISDLSQIRQTSSNNTEHQVWSVAFRPDAAAAGSRLGAGAGAGSMGKAFVSGGDEKRVVWWKGAGSG